MMARRAAISLDMLQYVPRIVFTIVVILSVLFLFSHFVKQEVDISSAEMYLFSQAVAFSPALVYYDPVIGELQPGIVDWEKFSAPGFEAELEKTLSYGESKGHLAAKVSLSGVGGSAAEVVKYYNKHYYDRFVRLKGLAAGIGGTKGEAYSFQVLLRAANGSLSMGVLKVEVLMPR